MASLRIVPRQLATRTMPCYPMAIGWRMFASCTQRRSPNPRSAPTARKSQRRLVHTSPVYLGTKERLPEFSLEGKVIVVTGGAQGLGLTQCGALLEAGATVYALDRQPMPSTRFYDIQQRAKDVLGAGFHYRQVDVRNVPALNDTVQEIADHESKIDGLIAAAGIQQETSALEYTAEDVNRMLEINVTGVFMTAQAVARQMIKRGTNGSMVLIASMSGTVANKGLICPAYNTSKGGVLQLGRNLAAEWGKYGIRVNTLSPGYILTKMLEDLFIEYPERRELWAKDSMLGRLSKPEEFRGAAVFLLSDASSFMTGTDLRIDGGHCAW